MQKSVHKTLFFYFLFHFWHLSQLISQPCRDSKCLSRAMFLNLGSDDWNGINLAIITLNLLHLQNVSNIWDDYRDWLNLNLSEEILPILALAADPLTENIFFIVNDSKSTLAEHLGEKVESVNVQISFIYFSL